jgi:hypothetical protein
MNSQNRPYRTTVIASLVIALGGIGVAVLVWPSSSNEAAINRHLNRWLRAQKAGGTGFEYWDDLARTPIDDPRLSPFAKQLVVHMKSQVESQRRMVRQSELRRLMDESQGKGDANSPEIQRKADEAMAESTKGMGFPFEERKTVEEPRTISGIKEWKIVAFEDIEICTADRRAFFDREGRADCIIDVAVEENGVAKTQRFQLVLFLSNGQWRIANLLTLEPAARE